MNRALWIVQGFLGLFFVLSSGAPKLLLPYDSLPMPIPLPAALIVFIGAAEVLGGLGLILPGLLKIQPGLPPLAASGVLLAAFGATVSQLPADAPANAVFAAVMGLLCSFVG